MSTHDVVPDAPAPLRTTAPTEPLLGRARPRGRQRPKWSELKGLLNVAPPAVRPADRRRARLARAADLGDIRAIARRVTPTGPFEYVDGAAHDEQAARRNRDGAAKAVCIACPVLEPCREHALRVREPYGVWGGMTEDEREAHYARAVVGAAAS